MEIEDTEDEGSSDVEPIDNAADPEAVQRTLRRTRKGQVKDAEFWKGVLASETGRRIIWGLLQDAGTFQERFACGPNGFPQVEATWFHAGSQAFGLRLYQSLAVIDRSGLFQMHDENDPRFAKPRKMTADAS